MTPKQQPAESTSADLSKIRRMGDEDYEQLDLDERLVNAGACGLNLEDTDHASGSLMDVDRQAGRIADIRSAAQSLGVDVVISARIDVCLHDLPAEQGLERASRYLEAGADCVYPILVSDLALVRDYVTRGATNVLWRPGGPVLRALAGAGVSRISLGPFLQQRVLKTVAAASRAFMRLDDDGLRA